MWGNTKGVQPEWVWRLRQEQGWEANTEDFYAGSYHRNYDRTTWRIWAQDENSPQLCGFVISHAPIHRTFSKAFKCVTLHSRIPEPPVMFLKAVQMCRVVMWYGNFSNHYSRRTKTPWKAHADKKVSAPGMRALPRDSLGIPSADFSQCSKETWC